MKSVKVLSAVVLFSALVGIAYAAGTPQPITGTVKDASGNPAVAGIPLKLYLMVDAGTEKSGADQPGAGGGGGKRDTNLHPEVIDLAGKSGIAKGQTTTDAKGNFAFPAQVPGNYRILAGSNPKTTGMANTYVTVNEGQPATVEIRLEVRK